MTKNLKKVVRKIYKNAKEQDQTKRTFDPRKYPINWTASVKALNAKGNHIAFNAIFKPLFKEILAEDTKTYLAAGHKLTSSMKKEMRTYAKEKAKEITKTQLEVKAAVKQGYKEQENVLSEG